MTLGREASGIADTWRFGLLATVWRSGRRRAGRIGLGNHLRHWDHLGSGAQCREVERLQVPIAVGPRWQFLLGPNVGGRGKARLAAEVVRLEARLDIAAQQHAWVKPDHLATRQITADRAF